MLGPKVPATAVGGAKQNSVPMNPPPQLLTPCAWTVHPPKGGASLCAVALGTWGLGAVTPIANTAADARPSGPEHV